MSPEPVVTQSLPLRAQTVILGPQEPLTLPEEFKRALGLDAGGVYTVVQFDGFALLAPKRLVSLEALEQMRRIFTEAGITFEDLLQGLEEIREQIYAERYG